MNLLFISNLFPSSKQPTKSLYNLYLLNALQNIGWTVEIINPLPYCPIIDSYFRKISRPPTHETLNELSVSHPVFFYTPGCLIEKHYWFYRLSITKSMKAGIKRLKERSPDPESPIQVMLGFIYPDAVAMAPICQKLKLNYSVRVNGSDFRLRTHQPKFRSLIKQCLHEAPQIFCPGYRLKEDMVKEGIDETKIHAFRNGVDTSIFYFSQDEQPEEVQNRNDIQEKSILFAGNLVDVKKVDRLLKAFAILIKDQLVSQNMNDSIRFRLDIVGDGALLSKLKALVQTLGLEEQVNFPGRELPKQIASRMRKADCLCLCSSSEGMPNIVIEALACGCPVVATDVGEVPYIVENGINGYSVATDKQSETEIIEQLHIGLRKVLFGKWDRQHIADRMRDYTWATAAETIKSVVNLTNNTQEKLSR